MGKKNKIHGKLRLVEHEKWYKGFVYPYFYLLISFFENAFTFSTNLN